MSKRSKHWVKVKNLKDEDYVVCGWIDKESRPSVILSEHVGDKLVYVAHVAMGLSREDFARMQAAPRAPAERYAHFPQYEGATWLEPVLVGTAVFMERTSGGGLRQPVLKGLRENKDARECVRREA